MQEPSGSVRLPATTEVLAVWLLAGPNCWAITENSCVEKQRYRKKSTGYCHAGSIQQRVL